MKKLPCAAGQFFGRPNWGRIFKQHLGTAWCNQSVVRKLGTSQNKCLYIHVYVYIYIYTLNISLFVETQFFQAGFDLHISFGLIGKAAGRTNTVLPQRKGYIPPNREASWVPCQSAGSRENSIKCCSSFCSAVRELYDIISIYLSCLVLFLLRSHAFLSSALLSLPRVKGP